MSQNKVQWYFYEHKNYQHPTKRNSQCLYLNNILKNFRNINYVGKYIFSNYVNLLKKEKTATTPASRKME